MRFWRLKRRRSAGIPVSPSVYRALRRGDAARGHDWAVAADAYDQALREMPGLAHIWIQLGHARNEMGDFAAAATAYRRSIADGGDIGEAHVHLGHVATRIGDWSAAAWHYGMAAQHGRDDGLPGMVERTRVSIPAAAGDLRAALVDLATSEPDPGLVNELAPDEDDAAEDVVTYDISDLIAHFGHFRLPTGIQRFQAEVLTRALTATTGRARICCFVRGRADLIELPPALFLRLDALSRSGGDVRDPTWLAAIASLSVRAIVAPPYRFTRGECLVNLGTSWSHHNYFLMVRDAKASHAITFVATVFDLIPVYAPQFCVNAITQFYINWLIGAVVHVDRFLAISRSTARDLARAGAQLGHAELDRRITVVPLDADFRSATDDASSGLLARLGLTAGAYALLVSTIEPRKNHLLALRGWVRLLRRHRADRVPPLVLVGRPGWLNDRIYDYLDGEPALAAKVVFVEKAGDADLAELYRGCAFTVYPSLYEGWGLPVTESLCYGKLPVTSDNSSLPEAGGEFASFFESGSVDDFVRAVEQAIFEVDWRRARERAIVERFRPRSWQEIADQVIADAGRAKRGVAVAGVSAARSGRLYPLGLYPGVGLWNGLETGERFRVGDGWLWPEEGCCRLAPGRATLCVTPPSGGAWKVLLLLIGLAREQCPFLIAAGDATTDGVIDPDTTRWSRPLTVATDGGAIEIVVTASFGEPRLVRENDVEQVRPASIGVAGIYLCPVGEISAFAEVLAAGLDGDVSAISTFSRTASWRGQPAAIIG